MHNDSYYLPKFLKHFDNKYCRFTGRLHSLVYDSEHKYLWLLPLAKINWKFFKKYSDFIEQNFKAKAVDEDEFIIY